MNDNIDVLVATMNLSNFKKKYNEMNIKENAIFANQTSYNAYDEYSFNKKNVRIVSTNTIGVGINRNIALMYSKSPICLLSDDDMIYNENAFEIIKEAFKKIPNADAIIFNIDTIGQKVSRRKNKKIIKINKFNSLNYGAVRVAFKRNSIIKKNIWFSTLFGGGTLYSSGEDTLFIHDILNKGLKIYAYPQEIGTVDQSTSSWFNGYNEKFFYDKGALISNVFPILYPIFILCYFQFRFKCDLSKKSIIKLMFAGARNYKKVIGYNEYNKKKVK